MIRILDRLLARSFMKVFVAFTLGAPVLFVLGDVTENLDDYLNRGLTWVEVAQAYGFMIPQYIQWSFPIAALVAAVFTVQSMTLHREVVAAKAGGISFHRLVAPLFVLGLVLTGVALGLEEVVPRSNRVAARILQQDQARRGFRANFVFQGEGGRNFAIRSLNAATGTAQGIVMETLDPATSRPLDHLTAELARYDPGTGWTFQNGYYRVFTPEGTEAVFQFQSLKTRGIQERPEDLLETPRKPEEMTFREMGRLAEIMIRSGGQPHKLLVDRQEKLAIPVATLIIILFGAPLATSTKRGGTAFGIGVALISTILYLLLFRISGALGETGGLPPFTAAWLPNLFFLGSGLIFLVRVRT